MKTIYAIRDRVANDLVGIHMYLLMIFRTDQQAARYFADAINDETSILNKHPADYELIKVGVINDTGTLGSLEGIAFPIQPVVVITGDALVAIQKPTLVNEA